RLGFSRYTGEVVHHIDTRVDGERDRLLADLQRGGRLSRYGCGAGLGTAARGFNGAGDAYETDGRLCVAILGDAAEKKPSEPRLETILAQLREAAARPGQLLEETASRIP
ncbi:MAG: LssY C-terminal domain-containing protein, partial [Syntrophomonadaceae bacterium]